MKKILLLFLLFSNLTFSQSQDQDLDATLQKILAEKNDDIKIDKLYYYFSSIQDIDPLLSLQISKKLLQYSQNNKDKIVEVLAISQIGYIGNITGNKSKSLEYALKTLKLAEQIGNVNLLAIIHNRLAHNYNLDITKQKELYSRAFNEALKTKNYDLQYTIASNIGSTYFRLKNFDSALVYLQKAEQLSAKAKYRRNIGFNFSAMGSTYAAMKKPTLAIAYFHLAIQEAEKIKSPRLINICYNVLAKFYYDNNQIDSSTVYAKKAIAIVQKTSFSNNVMLPAKLLKDIYRNKNNDLAMQYADMYQIANDSINSLQNAQRNQLMIFDENLRQQEIVKEKLEAKEQQKQNLQYIFIALGIISFLILFLLLSRSIIVKEKWISFFGILGLLIVFEFINLLIHPFLERVTHHSPILMLLCLVALASLLIPLHHKLEHWIKEKMTKKNKEIRLANAKKTIEELDEKR